MLVLVGAIFAGAAIFVFKTLKPELSPVEDRGTIISFFIGPEGATINFMDKYARRMRRSFAEGAGGARRSSSSSGNPIVSQGISFTRLKPWERARAQAADDRQSNSAPQLRELPACWPMPPIPPSLGQNASSRPVWIAIAVRRCEYSELNKLVEAVLAEAEKSSDAGQREIAAEAEQARDQGRP